MFSGRRIAAAVLAVATVAAVGSVVKADAKDDVQAAAKKLGESENYAWTQKTEGGIGGTTEGKVQKDGLTWMSMTFGDNTSELVFKGDKGAVKTQEGWQAIEEPGQGGGGGGGFNPAWFMGMLVRNFTPPAKQAEEVAGKMADLQKTEEGYSGTLSEEAAKEMLTFRRNRGGAGGAGAGQGPQVSNAKGSAKFWVKDGVLTKAQYKVQGTVSFGGNDRDVDRTTTVEIKDVGATKIEVPEEAKKKAGIGE